MNNSPKMTARVMIPFAVATKASLKLDWRGSLFAAAIGLRSFLNFNFVHRAGG